MIYWPITKYYNQAIFLVLNTPPTLYPILQYDVGPLLYDVEPDYMATREKLT
jgi:hypothetical protein